MEILLCQYDCTVSTYRRPGEKEQASYWTMVEGVHNQEWWFCYWDMIVLVKDYAYRTHQLLKEGYTPSLLMWTQISNYR